jgi:hypothetical protein
MPRVQGNHRLFTLSVACLAFAGAATLAKADTAQDVINWTKSQIERAKRPFALAPLKITYTVENFPLPDEVFNQIIREVEGKPEHPNRLILNTETRLRKNGSERHTKTFWVFDAARWRANEDFPFIPDLGHMDTVRNGEVRWKSTLDSLDIMNEESSIESKRTADSNSTMIASAIGSIFFGGLDSPASAERVALSAKQTAAKFWSVSIETDPSSDWKWSVVVEWSDEPRITEFTENLGQPNVSVTRRFSSHEYNQATKTLISRNIAKSGFGNPSRVIVDQIEALPPESADLLLAIPDVLSSTDATRGDLFVKRIQDLRGGTRRVLDMATRTETVTKDVGTFDPVAASKFRTVGWIVVGLVTAAIIALRIRRSSP